LYRSFAIISEIFDTHDEMPFGLEIGSFVDCAASQIESRLPRLERGLSRGLDQILYAKREG